MNSPAMWLFRRRSAAFAVLLSLGSLIEPVLADTTIDSGTTTVSTGTHFGTNLYVGNTGTATLNVVAGGYATNTMAYVGYAATGRGTVTVSSGSWASSSQLRIGERGTGTLNVAGGYVTSSGNVWLGNYDGSAGTAVVTSGTWATGVLTVGQVTQIPGFTGVGTLTMSGGLVTVASSLNKGTYGTINLNAGGDAPDRRRGSGRLARGQSHQQWDTDLRPLRRHREFRLDRWRRHDPQAGRRKAHPHWIQFQHRSGARRRRHRASRQRWHSGRLGGLHGH